ncbi:MAG TPA: LuxR family transcriptional regulator [Casimicrobiaceae bacterium]|nr:LuxR family transcriptional regulator [Casimicrobiaceae bacterium]
MDKRPAIHRITLKGVRIAHADCPEILAPLVRAAEHGEALEPVLSQIARSYGFDTLFYCYAPAVFAVAGSELHVLTNMPTEWVDVWEKKGYRDVDPRIHHIRESTLPLIWDQPSLRGRSKRVDAFLDDAQRFDARSGLAFKVDDAHHATVLMAFDSHVAGVDDARRAAWRQMLPFIRDFGVHFHELVMRSLVARLTSMRSGSEPSKREVTCLQLASQGLSRQNIAERMQVGPRTVQLYFDSIRAKLNASTREEAVAIAIRRGLI